MFKEIEHKIEALAQAEAVHSGESSLRVRTALKIPCDQGSSHENSLYRKKRRWHLFYNAVSIFRMVFFCIAPRLSTRRGVNQDSAAEPLSKDPVTIILLPHLKEKDAVGFDTMMICRALRAKGVNVLVHAAAFDATLSEVVISKQRLQDLIADPQTRILYQYCGYWAFGHDLLKATKGKVVLRYHNVTPARYLFRYNLSAAFSCLLGRMLIKAIVESEFVDFYLPASPYNARELQQWGAKSEKMHVLSPLSPHLGSAEGTLSAQKPIEKGRADLLQILVVGRVVPNKGHIHVIKTIRKYIDRFGPNISCVIVGTQSCAYKSYLKYLEKEINISGLSSHFSFISDISEQQVVQLYEESDVLLMLSEHEGFCVPIVEAQTHGLPVICLNRGAIKESLGPNQICYDQIDYNLIASAIYHVSHDETSRRFLIDEGFKNSKLHSPDVLEKELLRVWESEF